MYHPLTYCQPVIRSRVVCSSVKVALWLVNRITLLLARFMVAAVLAICICGPFGNSGPLASAQEKTATKQVDDSSPQETDKPDAKQPSQPASPQVSDKDNQKKASKKRDRPSYEKLGGIVYSEGEDYRLTCDVYIPKGGGMGDGPFPTVLAVHGGAWRGGSKLHMIRHAWRMAKRGYVVVAINYRHAPQHKFPAQIHDCKNALRWMRANAKEYKIDPDRIAAFGYSAGGHLVSLLGTMDGDDGLDGEVTKGLEKFDTRVCAVIAGAAPCEFSWIGERSGTLVYWMGQRRVSNPELYLSASPTHYVTPDDPPFFVLHGKTDMIVPTTSTEKLVELLRASDVEVEYDLVENSGHLMTFSNFPCFDRSIDFLDKVVKGKKSEDLLKPGDSKKQTPAKNKTPPKKTKQATSKKRP